MDGHAPAAVLQEAASQRQPVFAVPASVDKARPLHKVTPTLASWRPGGSFGKDAKQLLRCSQLFNELQAEVDDMRKRKRERDEEERAVSKRIALANPLLPGPMVASLTTAPATPAVKAAPAAPAAPAAEQAPAAKAEVAAAAPIFRVPVSLKAKAQRSLPAPLAWPVVHQCLDEVSPSAATAIKLALECWRKSTLSDEDLLATIRCHSTASPALAKALSSAKAHEEFEVASSDDMAALLKLSSGAIPIA
eukprot:CAMPEP_0173419240 /NCGR_PEP_ID=MMETSP1357-20121228/1162_1 /TAXON_ID=77926 /ORGANISM="Hemiselmis rufescens, Strain PCC563" /LENGTH=248 /DNA_ID=CAMNT_0014381861 /DNA_START=97 /DNA_END=843 /DNA_ORIENTATION=-